jgi:lysophospholipid acyltransferase (LPLAT)-like uncharacterized protein
VRLLNRIAGWIGALVLLAWRLSCRCRFENDPRPALRTAGRPYAYALLHAHQVGAVVGNDERDLAARVSRSADGELLVPSLRVRRVRAVRGSTRRPDRDKGGREALAELTELCRSRVPVLLAVDGPRGPRNHVHRGVVDLALEVGAVILPTVVTCSRRWILARTWDRMQVPKPFATVRVIFAEPIEPRPGEDVELLRRRLSSALDALEERHDPDETRRRTAAVARTA